MNTGLETLLLRHGIGFNTLSPFFEKQAALHTGFPPYNIEESNPDESNTRYRITLAVAGFNQDDITIEHERDILKISGNKLQEQRSNLGTFLHQGIAFRDFSREFRLGEYVEVTSAELNDGILTINLEQKIPEALAPKKIAIANKSDTKKK
jgi:molecular chaperone IbpA